MRSAPAMREACGREQQTGRDRALRGGGEASASGIAVQLGRQEWVMVPSAPQK